MSKRTELRTERLLLRPFQFGDVDDVVAMEGLPTWDESRPAPYTRRHAEEMIARNVLDSWETRVGFAMVMDGRVVGAVGMTVHPDNATAEIGYSLAEEHWGAGLTTEATRCAISWAFREYSLAKIFAKADVRNERSLRVMEKVGMTREGVSRSDTVIRGVRTDMVSYSLLREEWER